MKKKAQFLEIDFLFAIIILASGIILLQPLFVDTYENPQVERYSLDILTAMDTIPMNSFDNAFLESLESQAPNIINREETISRQIAILYVEGERENNNVLVELSRQIAERAIEDMLPENYGYQASLVSAGQKFEIISSPKPVEQLASKSMTTITGIEIDEPITGYSGSLFLSTARRTLSSHAFFGGFAGQGNITMKLSVPASITEFEEVYVEGAFGSSFEFHLNGIHCETINVPEETTEITKASLESCVEHAGPGENKAEIKFITQQIENHYAGGGFIKISYVTSQVFPEQTTVRKYLPGIKGVFNLYDAIHIPGELQSMNVYLDYTTNLGDANATVFFNLANKTLFEDDENHPSGNQVQITNSQLQQQFNYEDFRESTIPFRFGFENITLELETGGMVDVVMITDLSGSMNWRFDSTSTGSARPCNHPSLLENSTKRISVAQCVLYDFVEEILAASGNQLGLVSFSTDAQIDHSLSSNQQSLNNTITSYSATGWTCISCAIHMATELLKDTPEDRRRVMVVMSDGEANRCHSSGGSGSSCSNAAQDAVNYAEYAYEEHDISIYTIAFGGVGWETLLDIASVDDEENFYIGTDPESIQDVYEEISRRIVEVSRYRSQVISVELDGGMSELSGDSYIQYNYAPTNDVSLTGKIVLEGESEVFQGDSCEGLYSFAREMEPLSARITSYSREHWNRLLRVNGEDVYDLSVYGEDFKFLGDSFGLAIPPNVLSLNNNFLLRVGDSPSDVKECSSDNKFLYRVAIPSFFSTSTVYPRAEGCVWQVQFESATRNIAIPSGATNTGCSYTDLNQNYDPNDLWQSLAFRMFSAFDLDNEGVVRVDFEEYEIDLSVQEVESIPYMRGPALLELVVWQ